MFPLSAFSVTTSILKYRKAAPTVHVSLSNASAQRDSDSLTAPAVVLSQSCIPFPSQPIQCTRPARDEDSFDALVAHSTVRLAIDSQPWPFNACTDPPSRAGLGSFKLQRDISRRTHSPEDISHAQAPGSLAWPRKRKMAVHRVKLPSTGAVLKPAKRQKRTSNNPTSKSTTRRHHADLQFAAVLHRSIVAHLRVYVHSQGMPLHQHHHPRVEGAALRTQDQLLAERLWGSLTNHGLGLSPVSRGMKAARVGHIFQTEPLSAFDVFGPAPIQVAIDPPPPPPSPTDVGVLPLPQLVACLILRHRDRAATRPRSPPTVTTRLRSPLSAAAKLPPAHGRH